MDTAPAYVDWRACTATPLSGLSLADCKVRLKLSPLRSLPIGLLGQKVLPHNRRRVSTAFQLIAEPTIFYTVQYILDIHSLYSYQIILLDIHNIFTSSLKKIEYISAKML
jgi:hypothetical protein